MPMRSSLRERRREHLQQEILDAACNLLVQKGYFAMSMDELAAQAGISKPTLYSHFATKDELVAQTVAREVERVVDIMHRRFVDETPLRRLTSIIELIVRAQMSEERASMRVWMPELHKIFFEHPAPLAALKALDEIVEHLASAACNGGEIADELDMPAVKRAFYASIAPIQRVPGITQYTSERMPGQAARIFEAGVRR